LDPKDRKDRILYGKQGSDPKIAEFTVLGM
jgi:hypothetical protein